MNLTAIPGNPLQGQLALPGDKSLSHRSALLAALADGESLIGNFLVAGVTQVLLDALSVLGVAWQLDGSTLQVRGRGIAGLSPSPEPIHCGNSATTMRLLAGALAAAGLPAVLDGSAGLRQRPMQRIVEPLQRMGVQIEAGQNGGAPLRLFERRAGQRLNQLRYALPVASAQVKTCLLLAALAADGPTRLTEPALSRDHTERLLRSMGVQVTSTPWGEGAIVILTPPRPLTLRPLSLTLPGDISSAAFLIVAALLTPGSDVTLLEVGLNPTRTGLLAALMEMGADITIKPGVERAGEPLGHIRARFSPLKGITVAGSRVVEMIDEFPAFAVAAAFAQGTTLVRDAAELRHKESDRITAVCTQLREIGADIQEKPDGFVVRGGKPLQGGRVSAKGDHRLAMALAVAGLAASAPLEVEGAEIISESFPSFADHLRGLGADLSSHA
jgi:3-phosphoshikimate 1-carboxyvinyltransferase